MAWLPVAFGFKTYMAADDRLFLAPSYLKLGSATTSCRLSCCYLLLFYC